MKSYSQVTPNTCGECRLCCKVMGVTEIAKPANVWCQHCSLYAEHACTIYESRPNECRQYQCLWLASQTMPELGLKPMEIDYKPSVCGVVLSFTQDEKGITAYLNPGVDWRAGKMGDFLVALSRVPRRVVLIERGRRQVLWKGEILGEAFDHGKAA